MWATKFHIITNYKIHVFREQSGRNTIPNGAAMYGSAATELFAMYCAVCTLRKYLPVDRLKVDTICRMKTRTIAIIIIAIIT
jgi:hypothetical protein